MQPSLFGYVESTVPVAGRTPVAREASRSGARVALLCWTEKQSRLLQLLRNEPFSRQQLHDLTGIPINAVCSLIADLVTAGHVESNGDFEIKVWEDGSVTKRERFRVTRS